MIKRDSLLEVVKKLTSDERRKTACALLDDMYSLAKHLSEFEAVGEAALEVKYAELYLKCAEACYSMARTSEQLFCARENLYKAYNINNYPEKALFYIDLNLQAKPGDVDTLTQKAFNLSLCGKRREAEDIIEGLIASNVSTDTPLEYALSGKYLREGRTSEGIDLFVNTFKKENELFKSLGLKFWDGGIYPGKTIVINGEGGIGDEIINIRFLDDLRNLGMRPILYSSWHRYRPDLTSLFERHGYEVTTNHFFFKKDWLWSHMMSIPGYLGLREQDLWKGPYLGPLKDPKNRLPETSKFRIGIKANGNPHFEQDVYRRIPVEQLISYLPKDAEIYYIDVAKDYPGTISLRDKIKSWEDTLDYIDQMDVIVSSCTSLVHAAGAMGKRTIVMVPIAEYYVWTSTRTDNTTPWYGSNLTVLKQEEVRDWSSCLEKARQLIELEMALRIDK